MTDDADDPNDPHFWRHKAVNTRSSAQIVREPVKTLLLEVANRYDAIAAAVRDGGPITRVPKRA